MADIEITVDSGTSKRLLTAGKYCDKNIMVTATGGGGGEPEPPDDGKTRLYITVPANSMPDRPPPRNQVPLYIQQTVDRGVTIDWGDGTPTETLAGTGKVNTTHTYEQAGDYVISLDPSEGCELGLGAGSSSYCVMGSTSDGDRIYTNMLKKVYIGRNVYSIGRCAFKFCYSLFSVYIPTTVESIDTYAFHLCYSLSKVVIPDGVLSINNYSFYFCQTISSVVVSSTVSSIGSEVFYSCKCVKEYHFLSKTPPTLSGTSVFQGIPSDCIIYVPVGSLEAYQTATNWSTYADKMREEGT